ncbi:MAG: sigma 54-interacting transcriptional regulator [Clostridium sp.]|nr:sigma 54-interacting transcriptional regulator [Clostridium sp.]
MKISRIEIKTIDRPNMTFDITSVFVKYKINIIWMEVYTFVVYMKFYEIEPNLWRKIKNELLNIDGINGIEKVDLISFEEKEMQIKTIMDTVPQGVIVLNKACRIEYINKYAEENIFFISSKEINKKKLSEVIPNYSNKIEEMLQKIQNSNKVFDLEITINSKTYMLSINSIINDEGILCGFVITLQDIKRMREIINQKRYDNEISFKDIIGESLEIKDTINHGKIFAQSNSPVLIIGESGTGKELFARSIHNLSSRSLKPFVAINCAAIPDQLLESELFGYESGAFTGGRSNGKTGIFEVANGGTIFLDEIGEMPPHLQVKLLRVLQEKKVRKLGSNKETNIDVRIISATNRDIYKMVESNQFRLDLLYRINIFTLVIPSLRERKSDIRVLVNHYINEYSQKYCKNVEEITLEAMKKLLD